MGMLFVLFYGFEKKNNLNPRPTKLGGYQPPDGLSPAAQKRKQKVTPGIEDISFTSFAVILMKKKIWGYSIRWGLGEPSKFKGRGMVATLKRF